MAESEFDPRWVFSADGQEALCADAATYDKLRAAGWEHSPAVFGIETHPASPPQRLLMQSTAVQPQHEGAAQWHAIQATVKMLEESMVQMQIGCEALSAEVASLHAAGAAMHDRLQVLEGATRLIDVETEATAVPEINHAEPAKRGRRGY